MRSVLFDFVFGFILVLVWVLGVVETVKIRVWFLRMWVFRRRVWRVRINRGIVCFVIYNSVWVVSGRSGIVRVRILFFTFSFGLVVLVLFWGFVRNFGFGFI